MSYFVYADVERTSYDRDSIFEKFNTLEDAQRCKNDINAICEYDTADEVIADLLDKTFVPQSRSWHESLEEIVDADYARDWLDSYYSTLINYDELLIRYPLSIKIIEGSIVEE